MSHTQAATARDKLSLSHLTYVPGLSPEIDLEHLNLTLKGHDGKDIREIIVSADLETTIEGASTFTVSLSDKDHILANSGRLGEGIDVQIDGLWYRLVKVAKRGNTLTLTFEDREVAILRTYTGRRIASKNTMTRDQFVEILIKEPKEFKLPYVIPALKTQKPIRTKNDQADQKTRDKNRQPGFGFATTFQVKGGPADIYQQTIADRILATGHSMGARRKVLVASIMVAIQESTLHNHECVQRYGRCPDGPIGVFQQFHSSGWPASRDVERDAHAFFEKALIYDQQHPFIDYAALGEAVQHSGETPGTTYGLWRREAEHIVTLWGIPGGDGSTDNDTASQNNMGGWSYSGSSDQKSQWTRGTEIQENGKKKWKHEDTWACTGRLADEVQMRRFMAVNLDSKNRTFYFISEANLFKSRAVAKVSEDSDGIDWIDYEYDVGKKNAEITIQAHVRRWQAPPGCCIEIDGIGPVDGKWLVTAFRRPVFSEVATITCIKPRPRLPEPKDETTDYGNLTGVRTGVYTNTGRFMNPLPTAMPAVSQFQYVDAEGAPDNFGIRHHAGLDWFAQGGERGVAPIDGTLIELKPSRGNSGQVFGGVVKLRETGTGYVWVFRHVIPESIYRLGAKVQQGDIIFTVVRWADNPSSSHAHIEIWRTFGGGYDFENMVDPLLYIKGEAT